MIFLGAVQIALSLRDHIRADMAGGGAADVEPVADPDLTPQPTAGPLP